jgi:hypothetical protein
MDEVVAAVRERMGAAPCIEYAESVWMTREELAEMHSLRAMLPSPGEERREALERIKRKRMR